MFHNSRDFDACVEPPVRRVCAPRQSRNRRPCCRIIQDDRFEKTASVTVCAFTTDPTDAPLFRLLIEPRETNGLGAASRLMVDKITTVPKTKIGSLVGRLADEDILRLNRAVLVLAAPPVSK